MNTHGPTVGRTVLPFDHYDAARRDAVLRGACQIIDAQYRYWSTPVELTLLDIHSQIFRHLLDLAPDEPTPTTGLIRPTGETFGRPPAVAS